MHGTSAQPVRQALGSLLRRASGITGLWQVSGRNRLSYAQRVELDAEYVNNWSLWLDIKILAKTVSAVISGDGSR